MFLRVMRMLAVLVVGCGGGRSAPTRIEDHALPCGVTTIADLSPFEAARCEPNGTCTPGAVRAAVGSCSVAASSSFDLDAGRGRTMVSERGRSILSSDPPPYARRVIFDARVPTPGGIRVGMTGADLERMAPLAEMACTLDDPGWRGHLLCKVRRPLDCDAEDANWTLVVFDPAARTTPPVAGVAARALVRTRRILAIDLGPDCGE